MSANKLLKCIAKASTYLNQLLTYLENKDFSVNVISKSGTTTEPAIAFRIFREYLENRYPVLFFVTFQNRT